MFFSKPKPSQEDLQMQFNLAADTVHGHRKDARKVLQRINTLKAELAMLAAISEADQPLELETNETGVKVRLQETTMAGQKVIRMIKEEY
jgi:hypothetical protein